MWYDIGVSIARAIYRGFRGLRDGYNTAPRRGGVGVVFSIKRLFGWAQVNRRESWCLNPQIQ